MGGDAVRRRRADAISGTLETTYYVDAGDLPLAQAVAALVRDLVADAERMGIELRDPAI